MGKMTHRHNNVPGATNLHYAHGILEKSIQGM